VWGEERKRAMGRGCCVTKEGRRNEEGEGVGLCRIGIGRKGHATWEEEEEREKKREREEGRGVGREGEEKRGKDKKEEREKEKKCDKVTCGTLWVVGRRWWNPLTNRVVTRGKVRFLLF
jgi:hypothetical protein